MFADAPPYPRRRQRIVLINGAPRAGKNTLAAMIHAMRPSDSNVIGFSHHLKRCVHAIHFGLGTFDMDPDYFDRVKNEPQAMLNGLSWRQEYIRFSEEYIKPQFGKEWFGQKFVEAAQRNPAKLIIVPDSGFRQEAEVVIRAFGFDNVYLVRLHREGCKFTGDSRSHISLEDLGVPDHDLINETGNLGRLEQHAKLIAQGWV
jgi:hypothetical protein